MMTSHRRYLSTPGTLTVITGNRGSGKTDLSLRLTEAIIQKNPGIRILTNIVMLRKQNEINLQVITKLTELIENMIQYKRIHLILDEAGIFATSGNAGNRKDVGQWELFIKLFRKFGISMMWIDQRGVGSVPPTMRELTNFHIHKKDLFMYEIFEGFKGENGTRKLESRILTHTDRTKIPFDTDATGSFIMDLPEVDGYQYTVKDLFDAMANVNSKQARPTMEKWMDKVKSKQAEMELNLEREKETVKRSPIFEELKVQDIVFWILSDAEKRNKNPPGTVELSKILNRSKAQISNLKSKWKRENINIALIGNH